jgi:hypothetical protein
MVRPENKCIDQAITRPFQLLIEWSLRVLREALYLKQWKNSLEISEIFLKEHDIPISRIEMTPDAWICEGKLFTLHL